jgi:hypothetical protein
MGWGRSVVVGGIVVGVVAVIVICSSGSLVGGWGIGAGKAVEGRVIVGRGSNSDVSVVFRGGDKGEE